MINKIKTEYKSYSSIVDKIGEARIEERLGAIHEIYKKFLKQTCYEDKTDIIINDRILMHAILDYFADITRLKEFHDIKRINQDKIISYECSWLLRRKPIQVLRDDKEELIYVNEKFVFGILVNHLILTKFKKISQADLLNGFCETLLYYLKFRQCEPKILEMIILSFKAGNSINAIEYN